MDVIRVVAAVLLAGLATLALVLVLHHGTTTSTRPARTTPPHVVGSFKVAREFLEAVARMHDVSTLVAPPLKANEVIPYPVANARTARFKVLKQTPTRLYMRMLLHARPTSGLDPFTFYLQVKKLSGKWLVDYFVAEDPYSSPPPPH